jgi:hypothetical protein
MMLPRLALSSLLLGSPLITLAQSTEPAPVPRFYVGLAAYSSYYQQLGGHFQPTTGFGVPVQLTAGYQVRPRLAVQVGGAYSGNTTSYASEGQEYTTPGTPPSYFRYQGARTIRTTSISVLARRTLTRNPVHRMQFDALFGLGLEHRTSYTRGSSADSLGGSLQTSDFSYRSSGTGMLLTLGAGARYQLCPRFDLTFDLSANYMAPLGRRYSTVRGITGSAALGLRYRFGK